ncbi:hypothetical protein CBR_g50978 [Chara braunii]|uniref:Uncharacterized protein n=1 Tax=Chara braunii TaxID=69332 RepID=A0A388M818_CHABU|nr:hypothetical protein CBR_g50978 [Chara braunii]|eukprot:GBG90633.1 hypothetical protein CBR_g50978 [Chara braunii]
MPSLTRSSAMKRKKGEQLTRKKREVKRRRPTSRAEEDGEDDDFFGGEEHVASSEDEGVDVKKNRSRDVEEEQRADVDGLLEETAEEKRLRIAKAYLDRLKGAAAAAESESGGEEGEDDDDGAGRRGGDDDASDGEDDAVAAKLKEETAEATGRLLRKIAASVRLGVAAGLAEGEQRGKRVGRRHRQSVTSVALTTDDRTGFSASKDGAIYQWDVETNSCVEYPAPSNTSKDTRKQSRHLLSIAVSSDGNYLVAGGLDRRVHVWDTRTRKHVRAFAGHRGAVTCLSFRAGTNQLFSGSNDRAVKIWNVDDMAYVDSLFGHQSDVVSLDSLRRERILTCSRDKTCRLWKVPEETQLVFRGHQTTTSIDSCAFISASEFVSGGDDGSVALWSLLRKKPVFIVRNAHGGGGAIDQANNVEGEGKAQRRAQSANDGDGGSNLDGNKTASAGDARGSAMTNEDGSGGSVHSSRVDRNGHHLNTKESDSMKQPVASNASAGLGFRVGVEGWVGAIAACRGSDLLASGAGDGVVRVWGHDAEKQQLWTVGMLPSVGFVNSLAFAKSGRFLLAGMGQEPRLGRWGKNKQARNHVVMYKINLES